MQKFTTLYTVDLSYNQITNIDSLKNLTGLLELNVSYNDIEKIPALSDLYSLDISSMEKLSSLVELSAKNNNIERVFANISEINMFLLDLSGQAITIQINEQNSEVDLPQIFSLAYENRYKKGATFSIENCEVDWKNQKIMVKSLKEPTKIKIIGGIFDQSEVVVSLAENKPSEDNPPEQDTPNDEPTDNGEKLTDKPQPLQPDETSNTPNRQ